MSNRDALEYLFAMIDADNNGYLSRSEMAVFKKFLGLGHAVTEEEWSDILCKSNRLLISYLIQRADA